MKSLQIEKEQAINFMFSVETFDKKGKEDKEMPKKQKLNRQVVEYYKKISAKNVSPLLLVLLVFIVARHEGQPGNRRLDFG
jgi:hypothetical protein